MTKRNFLSALLLGSFLATGWSTGTTSSPLTTSSPDPIIQTTEKPVVHEERYAFKIACPEREIPFMEEQLEKYLQDNDWVNVTLEVVAISTGDIVNRVEDWNSGPDLFAFCSDAIGSLLSKGVLDVISKDGDIDGRFAIDDTHFAYPYSGDNGYFLYYDRELFAGREEKLETVEGILEVCRESGREFCYPLGDPFYSMAFLQSFGAGYDIQWNRDERRISTLTSAFATEEGLLTAKAMMSLVQDPNVFATEATAAPSESNGFAAVVDGSWSKERYIQAMGEENLGAAPLPSISYDGKTAVLKSYLSYKMYGVNPLPSKKDTGRLGLLHDMAVHLVRPEVQKKRHKELGILPLDSETGESCGIEKGSVEGALLLQGENAIVQGLMPETLWTAPESLFLLLEKGQTVDDEALMAELQKIDTQLTI